MDFAWGRRGGTGLFVWSLPVIIYSPSGQPYTVNIGKCQVDVIHSHTYELPRSTPLSHTRVNVLIIDDSFILAACKLYSVHVELARPQMW